ncbi:MAG: hypothetical protein R6U32_00915 [Candidatus Woesearchaeota archaeon]
MKRRFEEVLDMIEFNELVNMKRDIDKGGTEIEGLISRKLKEEIKKHDVRCTTCQARIDPYSTSNFTLVFGPEDLKKKATFCALDCLEYFLENLKDLRRGCKNEKQEHDGISRHDSGHSADDSPADNRM